ncbi:hypothetical protein At12D13_42320 [Agrobacterium fabrum]|nr:hypothetical protein At12D13_42320 [Agrobacterium fabrum]
MLIDSNIDSPHYKPVTAWLMHGPFAMWLVRNMRPRRIVELGTHYGFSYFSFCQAVASSNLIADCFAVDTWSGDEHAGYYDDSVYSRVVEENEKYAPFSTLLRKTFVQALDDIEDNSIDILHIDGRHFYDDVKEDFISWTRKLSDRAVVLFHDTEVRERDFGVWRFWAEIAPGRPSINLRHEHGLGVLFWGENVPDELRAFVSLIATEPSRSLIENYFQIAGQAFSQKKWFDEQLEVSDAKLASERQDAQGLRRKNAVLIEEISATKNELEDVKNNLRNERKNPLSSLRNYVLYIFLIRIARVASGKFPNFCKRVVRSAAKRDPNRAA